jgi:hypothetical protein
MENMASHADMLGLSCYYTAVACAVRCAAGNDRAEGEVPRAGSSRRTRGPVVHVLRIAPLLSITQEHCDRMLKICNKPLKESEAKS